MSNLTTFLDRLDKKTAEICELNALIKQREDKHSAFQSVVFNAFSGPPKKGESSEDYVLRIAADKATLELRRRELVGIITAIDELPLPKADDESYEQYVLRLGDYLRAITSALKSLGPCDGETVADSIYRVRRERNDAERKVGELSLSHSLAMEKAAAEIEKLGKRDAELLALYDVVESFPAFPMQPAETYSEYLRRLQARLVTLTSDLARLVAQIETGNGEYAAERAKNQLLTDQLQNTCSSEELADALRERDQARRELADEKAGMKTQQSLLRDALTMRDKAQEEAKTAVAEREHFRAKWDASLKSRDSAQDEARRTRETNEALQGQLTAVVADNAKQRQLDRVISEATLRTALLVVKCLHSCAELGVIIDASDWGDECGRVIEMAKAATDDDDLILEADFAEKWASRISDPMKRCARLATEHTALLNRVSSVSRLEGELSLHLQIIARLMMQPTIAPMINALEWNGSAQQVLKVARGMFGDVQDVLVTKEPQ